MEHQNKKAALFVFNGDPMCFIHVLLNGLNLADNGYAVRIVIEGAATQLVPQLDHCTRYSGVFSFGCPVTRF